jgi:ATP-dependent helicase/nuclease subunit A
VKSTLEQLLAQSADRHLAVTAGAGAGKTTVLIQRFVHLLLTKRVDVRSITAITFTRKAASEMKSRLSASIEALLADPAHKDDWERIKHIRERLNSVNISTIHGFCARLLREFPIEAGVNPNFTEMQEYEAVLLKERAVIHALEEWLDTPSDDPAHADRAHHARALWSVFGKKQTQELLKALVANGELFAELRQRYAAVSDAEFLSQRDRVMLPFYVAAICTYLSSVEDVLALLDTSLIKSGSKTIANINTASGALAALQHQLQQMQKSLDLLSADTDNDTANTLWNQLRSVVEAIQAIPNITKTGSLSLRGVRDEHKLNPVLFDRLNARLPHAFKPVLEAEECLHSRALDSVMLRLARIAVDIAADAVAFMQSEKERLGALDFDDLQMKTDVLLNNPDVQEKLRRKVRYLMIDEFQDTNELQYRIAKKVISSWGTESLVLPENSAPVSAPEHSSDYPIHQPTLLSPASNLFIVGDPKQSIYRFRGADVRVFAHAKHDIHLTNSALLASKRLLQRIETPAGFLQPEHPSQAAGMISLAATFRLSPTVADIVNRVCGTQMQRKESVFDVEYEEIICALPTLQPSQSSSEILEIAPQAPLSETVSAQADTSIPTTPTEQTAEQPILQWSGSMMLVVARKAASTGTEAFAEHNQTEHSEYASQSSSLLSLPPSLDSAANQHTEESLLAAHLRSMIERKSLLVRQPIGSGKYTLRPAGYGDIFILARSRTGFDELTRALRREGIPFVVSGGRGYYERQEMLDMRSMLLFLHNQGDDISCAAVLRSPMFTVSDEELYSISRAGGTSFWQRACTYYDQFRDSRCSPEFRRAMEILKTLLPLASRLTIPSLLRTITEQTAWRAAVAADERFDQIEANIEKLLQLARDFEQRGFRNLFDFAEELRIVAEYNDNEGEADVALGSYAVTLMTIHASKGLEAPIVVLYKANSETARTEPYYVDAEYGLACMLPRAAIPESFFGNNNNAAASSSGTRDDNDAITPPLYVFARRQAQLAERAEAKRLLYVALTRAKDHLIVSGTLTETRHSELSTPKGFLGMILEGLGYDGYNLFTLRTLDLPAKPLRVLINGRHTTISLAPSVSVLTTPPLDETDKDVSGNQPKDSDSASLSLLSQPLLLAPLRASIEGDIYSASQLRLFERDATAFEYVYRLGLPPEDEWENEWNATHVRQETHQAVGRKSEPALQRFTADDDDERAAGVSVGTSIHALLQHLPEWLNPDGMLDIEHLEAIADRVLPLRATVRGTLGTSAPSDALLLREQILHEVQRTVQTPFIKRFAPLLTDSARTRYEYVVTVPFDHQLASGTVSHDILTGTLDVLLHNERGEWEIWDWKTNRVASQNDCTVLAEEYRLQMELYAYFVAQIAPEQPRITTRLLFTKRARAGALDQDWMRIIEFSREHIGVIERHIASLITDIRTLSYGV